MPTAGVRTNVQELLTYSWEEKKRNFLETVELQMFVICPSWIFPNSKITHANRRSPTTAA